MNRKVYTAGQNFIDALSELSYAERVEVLDQLIPVLREMRNDVPLSPEQYRALVERCNEILRKNKEAGLL